MKKQETELVNHSFGPFLPPQMEILILGSFPSRESRKQGFYYMHPNNRFYRVLSEIFEVDFYHASIDEKKKLLSFYHIGLYDVIDQCTILNSSDASIQNVVPIPLESILKEYPVKKIFLNGKKAYELFVKYFPSYLPLAVALPSTSSANASYSLLKLLESWKEIKKFVI